MPKKKVKKFRGSRTCGGGSHKNNRSGRGSRGGAGNAGMFKHKYLRAIKIGYEIGKYGFTRPKTVRADYRMAQAVKERLRELKDEGKLDDYTYKFLASRPELNVGDLDIILDRLVELGIAAKEGETYSIDLSELGYTKLLGAGKITKQVKVIVDYATPKAAEKIQQVGGSVEA
ncbi:uL15m family ribosomal protein [Archaeoglobus veneficus]|uniref:Large ribosomal subunit protein uL15 n=1 Tax=Archaeoglobus veneficus (strain DSM 11195 / SNP6) TaxID=693661 RepID=F2KSS9_ARCVS|nr:uL15 family ribosomal protein [Archaeoglobus veneficus]AEA46974.1 50S ribosomal protein L15P (rpl15P) [Archaeoglobus veneficus SNP6]